MSRSLVRRWVSRLVRSDVLWRALDSTLLRVARSAEWERAGQKWRRALPHAVIEEVFSGRVVRNGVFAGMRYPEDATIEGPLFPRLLGSYESEIRPVLETICDES